MKNDQPRKKINPPPNHDGMIFEEAADNNRTTTLKVLDGAEKNEINDKHHKASNDRTATLSLRLSTLLHSQDVANNSAHYGERSREIHLENLLFE